MIWGTLPQSAIQESLTTVSQGNETYKGVSYVEMPQQGFSTQLSDAIAAGEGPDMVLMSTEDVFSERNKLQLIAFSSIPQRAFIDSYLSLFELLLTTDGTYGVPLVADPLMLYYNRTLLSAGNIVDIPPAWEGVAALVPQLTVRDGAGVISRSAIALGEYTNVQNARAILSLLFLQSGTSITQTTTNGVRTTLQGEKNFGTTPAESAVNFYTQFADPAKTVYSWNRSLPNSRDNFVAGDSVMYVGFASELPYLSAANPNLNFDVVMVPQPATGNARTTYGVGYAFVLPKQSKNPTGAFTVATALTDTIPMASIAHSLSMSPARKNLLSSDPNDIFSPVIYSSALVAKGWLSPSPSITDGIFAGMIGNITSGRLDVTQALGTAAQSLDASLR